MIAKSRASRRARARSFKYCCSTDSMNAERDCFDPAMRSIPLSTSRESVIDVFSFILLLYYHAGSQGGPMVSFLSVLRGLLWREHFLSGRTAANPVEAARGSRQTHLAIPCIREPLRCE